MAKMTRLSAEQRENLVAYLDGELDEAATQQVEQVLAESVVARHDVDMLSRTWDLMNVLPGVKASEEFTRKTLSSIRAAESPRSSPFGHAAAKNLKRGLTLVIWAAVVVGAAVLGFQATRLVPNPADELLDNLDVIANFDDYREVGDVEFLKALRHNQTLVNPNESADK
jgi:anti-sigma factor RsiW